MTAGLDPLLASTLLKIAIPAILIGVVLVATRLRGLSWREDPGLAGPAAEELVMRGALLGRLRRTALGPAGAIVLVAAVWAVMHHRYGWTTVPFIAAGGVVLGAARQCGRSLWIPIVMHAMGNLVSLRQSLNP